MDFYALTTTRKLETNDIVIDGDSLTITLANAVGNTSLTGTVSLSEVISSYSQDHGCIAILPRSMVMESNIMVIETTQLSQSEKAAPGDSYTSFQTNPGKHYAGSPFSVIDSRFRSYAYLYILTPSANCSPSDCTILYRDLNANVTVNGSPITPVDTITSTHAFLANWMPITISGGSTITAGSTATYTVTGTPNTTIYVSTDSGTVNRSRVAEGGTFQLNTSGLDAGEQLTIKVGYKTWSGVATKVITLE